MKRILITCAAVLLLIYTSHAQSAAKRLTVNGLPFISIKKAVLQKFGNPVKTFDPHYDCGFLSDEQRERFHTLQYDGLKWTGNEKQGYLLEDINLESKAAKKVMLDKQLLTVNSTQAQILKAIGEKSATTLQHEQIPAELRMKASRKVVSSISLKSKQDDKWIFYFIAGKLVQISYWSPC